MKKYLFFLIFGLIIGLFLRDLFFDQPAAAKVVTVRSRNLTFQMETRDSEAIHGSTLLETKAVGVVINDGGERTEVETESESVGDLIYELGISLAKTDRVTPSTNSFLAQGMEVRIDRIVDLEIVEESEIPFQIERTLHSVLPYGREEVVSEGVAGLRRDTFLITYKNGAETARKLLSTETVKQVQNEKRLFGTLISVEEEREGRASWYAFRDCMCAAHPFYAKGRYARVTSLVSGKSIIVRINDFGPDLSIHPDRVIDLDAVAYAELAPLGSGTIAVKVELIKN